MGDRCRRQRRGPGPRGAVHLRTLPATRVASVVFDPEVVSPAVVYHGLTDWLRWRKKDKKIQRVVSYREVYRGNPWKDKSAYSRTDVQFVVRPVRQPRLPARDRQRRGRRVASLAPVGVRE